jgi:hypothetical protein
MDWLSHWDCSLNNHLDFSVALSIESEHGLGQNAVHGNRKTDVIYYLPRDTFVELLQSWALTGVVFSGHASKFRNAFGSLGTPSDTFGTLANHHPVGDGWCPNTNSSPPPHSPFSILNYSISGRHGISPFLLLQANTSISFVLVQVHNSHSHPITTLSQRQDGKMGIIM